VRRTVSGLLKVLYPHGEYPKEAVRKCLEYALEVRRRVKEQLKKIGGMEFYDVHFSYIDLEDGQERFVSVPEQSGGALIPEARLNPGTLHTVSAGSAEMPGAYRIEIQCISGTGKASASGPIPKEAIRVAFDYFKANASRISGSIKPSEHDFHIHMVELQNTGQPQSLTLASFIGLCSAALSKPIQQQMVILGDMSLGGTVTPVRNLAECLQVAFDAGAKRVLLPMSSVGDIPSIPGELFAKFQTGFYSDPVDAVFKAVGVE
jgi:ATP-dependent Lon protease